MAIRIPFQKERSSVLGDIPRPYIPVLFWSKGKRIWIEVLMIADSGADYTLLPKQYMEKLGVNSEAETIRLTTSGVGGTTEVYFLKRKVRIKVGDWARSIPIGFLNADKVPPLFGRHECMNTFKVLFHKLETTIDSA